VAIRAAPSKQTVAQRASGNPIVSYIKTQQARGMPKQVIMEKLMLQGYPYRNIKNAFGVVNIMKQGSLDWRSPTAINETARMIRRDVRAGRVTYAKAMRILLQARENLKTLIASPRDRRLKQMNNEIRITKKLLMQSYGDPNMVRRFSVKA
jgi:hypothetical protein